MAMDGKNKGAAWLVHLVLAYMGTLCLPYMLNVKGNYLAVSNSWFSVFIWAVLWFCIHKAAVKAYARDRREILAAGVLGFLFSLSLAFGVSLEQAESVNLGNGMMWLSAAVWTVIFTLWICKGWECLKRRADLAAAFGGHATDAALWHGKNGGGGSLEEKDEESNDSGNNSSENNGGKGGWRKRLNRWTEKWERLSGAKRAAIMICFFLLCWLPVFLAVYPGFFVYDAQDELIQVQTRNFTSHHPLPHVLLLGGIILAVNKLTGSYNAGIAAYTLLQMCLMAGVFAYVLSYMRKCGVKRIFRAVTAFYFSFFPVIVMFALCSAKDGIFTAALLLLLIALDEMTKEREKFFTGWKRPLFFGASALIMMCFRHNGMYAFLVLSPFLLIYMKGCRKKLAVLLGTVFGIYFLLSFGLTTALSAGAQEKQEMLTVPVQQLARVYKYDKESFSREELETLYEIIPEEAFSYYAPKVSDGVKIWFQNDAFAADPVKYGKLWLETGLRHPAAYLNAWLMTSYGFWYPDTVIDVYRGNSVFTFTYEDSSFFGYEVEQPGTRESKMPWLDACYRKMSLEIAQQKLPVVSMLFSPGFLFWLFAFTAGYVYYRKEYRTLLVFGMIFLVWLTVILGPTYLPRYVLILWFALPGAVVKLAE